jgi:hypothetical protein
MNPSPQDTFIAKLEERYGQWNKSTSKFGATSFGVISRDLSISASQFSKLIYGTATEGMYERSVANINRLIQRDAIRKELQDTKAEMTLLEDQLTRASETAQKKQQRGITLVVTGLLLGTVLAFLLFHFLGRSPQSTVASGHPLAPYFDQEFTASFQSPYLDIAEVQAYCPCSAFEGEWRLTDQYKLPLPGSRRPGLYYLAKSADVRMKCSQNVSKKEEQGFILTGYEYLVNEIWLDLNRTPLSPKYFDNANLNFTPEFYALDFENNPNFVKIATIESFFTDRFELSADSIVRTGEPCGRFASEVNEEMATRYEIDIKYILKDVLGNMTRTRCSATENLFCNPK